MTPRIVHQGGALTAESPCWDAARSTLWYIDIQGQRLFGYSPDEGAARSVMLPSMPGFVVPEVGGGLVLGLEDGLWLFHPDTGEMSRRVPVEADDPRTRLNEGKADGAGRLWFGSMDKTGLFGAIGSLYCHDPDRGLNRLRGDVGVPNAIDVSVDGGMLFFADTSRRIFEAHEFNVTTGDLGASRVLREYSSGEAPDGVTVAADDSIWLAVVGGGRIDRYDAGGRPDGHVPVPVSRPTAAAFGGSDLSSLFVTSQRRFLSFEELACEPAAGALIELPGVGRGRPPFSARIR